MKRTLALLLVLCTAAALLAGCGQEAQPAQGDSQADQTLVIGLGGDVATLDPAHMSQSIELYIGSCCIYDVLTWLPLGEEEPQMRLAESYTVSDDGMVYTFTLRDGTFFHNGEPITAEDVLYSVDLFCSAATLATYSYSIADCQAPDEKTIVITLNTQDRAFLENLNCCFILPKQAYEEAGDDFSAQPIGSGPYTVESYTPGDKLVLKAFPEYYRGKAAIENCEMKIITDQTTMCTALETGEVHLTDTVPFSQIEMLEQSGSVTCEIRESFGAMFLYGPNHNPPYDNALVRKALGYAIDRDMCNDVMYSGYGSINPTPLSNVVVDAPQGVQGYSYNPEKARELLAEAGYPDGEGMRPVAIQTYENCKKIAEVIQSNLRDVGIEAEIEVLEFNAFLTNVMNGNVDLVILSAGINGNAATWASMVTTGGEMNFYGYSNPEVDELYARAIAENDAAKRQSLYDEAYRIFIDEDAAVLPIICTPLCYAISTKLDAEEGLNNAYTAINPYDLSFKEGE